MKIPNETLISLSTILGAPSNEITIESRPLIHDSLHVVGNNRGNARVWLQAKWLITAGFSNGTIYSVNYSAGKMTIEPSAKGRKVAGSIDRPIIDLNSKKVTDAVGNAYDVHVRAVKNKITISIK
jgi:hypothetical protein